VTVADAVALESAAEVAVIVIPAGLGTVFGAMNNPELESIAPPEELQVTVWFEVPLTVAVYVQFAPTPIALGALAMLTEIGCCVKLWPDDPHPAIGRTANTGMRQALKRTRKREIVHQSKSNKTHRHT